MNVLVSLTYLIEVPSIQKATAVREKCADYLAKDDQVEVVSSSQAQTTHRFEVLGVDTTSKRPFKEQTEAKDAEQAEANVIGSSKSKVAAEVRTLS